MMRTRDSDSAEPPAKKTRFAFIEDSDDGQTDVEICGSLLQCEILGPFDLVRSEHIARYGVSRAAMREMELKEVITAAAADSEADRLRNAQILEADFEDFERSDDDDKETLAAKRMDRVRKWELVEDLKAGLELQQLQDEDDVCEANSEGHEQMAALFVCEADGKSSSPDDSSFKKEIHGEVGLKSKQGVFFFASVSPAYMPACQ
ncbi:hypothetical protein BDR26DRAFT_900265 [Obelidium mucronatum]|nr:hypothetical protein BDR26DRAFT_900265 [Obelidium mucronatum]